MFGITRTVAAADVAVVAVVAVVVVAVVAVAVVAVAVVDVAVVNATVAAAKPTFLCFLPKTVETKVFREVLLILRVQHLAKKTPTPTRCRSFQR